MSERELSPLCCRGNGVGENSYDRKRHILDLLCQCRNVGLHDVMVCKYSQREGAAPLTLWGARPPLGTFDLLSFPSDFCLFAGFFCLFVVVLLCFPQKTGIVPLCRSPRCFPVGPPPARVWHSAPGAALPWSRALFCSRGSLAESPGKGLHEVLSRRKSARESEVVH